MFMNSRTEMERWQMSVKVKFPHLDEKEGK